MLTSIKLNSLRNAEYIQFIKSSLAITRANDPVALKVKPQYDDLQAKLVMMEGLFLTEQGSFITPEVTALDIRRDRAVTGLTLAANAYTYYFDPVIARHAGILSRQIAQYGGGIARENYQAETTIIENLLVDLGSNPGLAAAIAALRLGDWKDELEAANKAFSDTYIQRTQQLGAATDRDKLPDIRLEANESYYRLRDFIDSYYVITSGAEPYAKTTKELNALLSQYNTMMAGRLGNGKEEPPVLPAPPTSPISPTTGDE